MLPLVPYPYNKTEFKVEPASWFGAEFGAEQVEIADQLTPMSADEVAIAVSSAFKRLTGKRPSRKILGLLLAQWALESGNGRSIHNFNLTNIKRNSGDPYYQSFPCSEVIDGVEQHFTPPNKACEFAAYLNATDGAEAYIRVLKRRPNWWNGLMTGDVEQFNIGLSTAPKFYTADPARYLNLLKDRYDRYWSQAEKYGSNTLGTILSALFGISVAIGTIYATPKAYQYYRSRRP